MAWPQIPAGEKVEEGVDETTGVVVISRVPSGVRVLSGVEVTSGTEVCVRPEAKSWKQALSYSSAPG